MLKCCKTYSKNIPAKGPFTVAANLKVATISESDDDLRRVYLELDPSTRRLENFEADLNKTRT